MDITGLTGIVYKLHVYNDGVDLDTLDISDVLPTGLNSCQIENVLTTHVGVHTSFGSLPVAVSNPLWTAQDFLNGDEVTIIISCDVPITPDTYSNLFTVDVEVNGSNTVFQSNTVIAEVQPTLLYVDKTQNNWTQSLPATGVFAGELSGGITFLSGDIFTFALNYGNNSSGAISNVQLIDTFPSGFVLQSSSLTGLLFSCDGAQPVFFPVQPTECTWNLGTLAVGQSGTIYLTGIMSDGTQGWYLNTGSIYTDGVLIDDSTVHQIPVIPDLYPDLELTKYQMTAANSGFVGSSCNPFGCVPWTLSITTQNNYYLQYTIVLENNGSGQALDVVIADTLPQGFIPIYNAPTYSGTVPGSCDPYSGPSASGHFSLQCEPNIALPAGGAIEITIDGQVTTDASPYGGS